MPATSNVALIVSVILTATMPSYAQGPASDPAAQERAWSAVKDSSNISALEAFVRRYPDTLYSDLAQLRIDELKKLLPPPAAVIPEECKWTALDIQFGLVGGPFIRSRAVLAVKDARNKGPIDNGKITMPSGDVVYPVHVDYGPWANSNVFTTTRPGDFSSKLGKNECKP